MYYNRARWYDPQARRFISEDPIGLDGGINLYAYVDNNPVNGIDPLGLWRDPINNPQLRGFYPNAGWKPSQSGIGQVRGSNYHMGYDLFALPGTAAFAALNGNVVHAGTLRGYGKSIIIRTQVDNRNVYLLYGHLSRINVKRGDCVQEGSYIADTGKTGNAENDPDYMAHLHFEVMKNMEFGRGAAGLEKRENPGDFMQLNPPNISDQTIQYWLSTYPWVPR